MVANSSPSELSLECKPQSYSMLLKSWAADHLQVQKLEEYLSCLEEERLKIDAFKRELPLCMQLLTNAMEASRQKLQSCKATSTDQGKRPILEEFIPMNHTNSEGSSEQRKAPNTNSDKANWMTSAQLWSQTNEGTATKQSASSKEYSEMGVDPKLITLLDITNDNNNKNKQRNVDGGAFLPFTKERVSNNNHTRTLPADLALMSDERESEELMKCESGFACEDSRKELMDTTTTQTNVTGATTASQTHRKQRRCWSPDLHRRFVNALHMLGGSQVATPKQIRELMKVDGLTNDEVKSHLQKYRLHTRRPGPGPQQAGAHGPQLVVLGGIWVPPEYAHHHHHMVQQQPTIYSAHPSAQVGPHYCPPTMAPQTEFYPPPLPQAHPQQLRHHPNHQIHIYQSSPQRQRSPESDGARDRSESIDDDKSGSSSWKGESGEESNEEMKMKKLASMREGEEESNGSEITLKF